MRINRMKLIDWRNHAETDIHFEKLTVFRGANHSGKSSIRDAAEYALTGRADATDAKGSGAVGLIRTGADKATILMKLQANKEIDYRCVLTKSGRTTTIRDEKDAAWTGEGVKGWLDSQRDVLSCVLNTRYFIRLTPAEQKKLLCSIILPDSYIWPDEIQHAVKQLQLAVNWSQTPFEVIESAYKLAFDRRRDVNRDLKNLVMPTRLASPEGAASLEEARQKRSELCDRREALEKTAREASRDRGAAEARVTSAGQRVESLAAKLRMEQETLAQTENKTLSPKQAKELQKTAASDKELARLEADKRLVDTEISGIQAIIAVFDGLDGKRCCPMCQRDVTDEWLIEALKPHNDALNNAYGSQREILKAMKELGDVEGAQRKLEENERSVTSRKRSQSVIAETEGLLRTAREELETAQNALSTAGEPAEEPEELTALRSQISDAHDVYEAFVRFEVREKEFERAEKQRQQLSAAAASLNELVTYFGPEGVKAELLQQHIGAFEGSMNAALNVWGYEAQFSIEPYGFTVHRLDQPHGLQLEYLSESERLRFAVAFQVALAQVSGIRMVIVDETEIFDEVGRQQFYPMLMNADLDQVVTIGTDEREEVPEAEGVAFYAMQEGKARLLEGVAA